MRRSRGLRLALSAIPLLHPGCGGGTDKSFVQVPRSYTGTASPGDVWDWTLDNSDGTFTATNETQHYSLSGGMRALKNGFSKLTVAKGCDGAGCTPGSAGSAAVPNGDTFHGVEAPGFAFLARPDFLSGHVITTVATGDCAGLFRAFNFVKVGFFGGNYNPFVQTAFGTFTLSGDANAFTLDGTERTFGRIFGPITATSIGGCAEGAAIISSGGSPVNLQVASGGPIMIDFGTGGGGVAGFPQNGLTLKTVGNRTYVGVLNNYKQSGDDGTLVQVKFNSDTLGTGAPFKDADADLPALQESVSITMDDITDGMVRGSISGGQVTAFRAAAFQSAGATFLYLVSYGSDGPVSSAVFSPINLLLVSQPAISPPIEIKVKSVAFEPNSIRSAGFVLGRWQLGVRLDVVLSNVSSQDYSGSNEISYQLSCDPSATCAGNAFSRELPVTRIPARTDLAPFIFDLNFACSDPTVPDSGQMLVRTRKCSPSQGSNLLCHDSPSNGSGPIQDLMTEARLRGFCRAPTDPNAGG